MNKKAYLLMPFLILPLLSNAQQVPNAGFEDWSNPKTPDGWYTYSSSSFIINLANKDTVEKVERKASAKIHTELVSFSMVYEILSLGTANYSFNGGNVLYTFHPIYFPFRPDTLFFAYKYSTTGIDTATASIKLMKGTTTLLSKEIPLIKSANWSFPYLLLTPNYLNANKPDSLLIQFKSSKTRANFFGVNGSTLNIDNVHFGYVNLNSSAQKLTSDISTSITPNPFSNQLTFSHSSLEETTFILYDYFGHQVLQKSFTGTTTINTEQLASGIYIYALQSGNGTLKYGKILKQ